MTHPTGAQSTERSAQRASADRADGHADVPFPATLTILSAEALGKMVAAEYDVGAVIECKLFTPGLTHTYLVQTEREKYMLRVYRAGWRTSSDILYELDVLRHLALKGVSVSTPVACREGSLVRDLRAQEGLRSTVLFTHAAGRELHAAEGHAERYGRAVAAVHNGMDDFRSRHTRFQLDLDHLLDQPLTAIRPFLQHRPEDWHYFERLGETLRERIVALPIERLETGFCHGDFHGGNAYLDGETITFFDFDCGGPGLRAYDIAVFRWALGLPNNAKARTAEGRWADFREGYTSVRTLGELDLAAVPIFVAIRHLWWLGLQCSNARDWGYGFRGDRFFDRALKFLRPWERKHLAVKRPCRQRSARPTVEARSASTS